LLPRFVTRADGLRDDAILAEREFERPHRVEHERHLFLGILPVELRAVLNRRVKHEAEVELAFERDGAWLVELRPHGRLREKHPRYVELGMRRPVARTIGERDLEAGEVGEHIELPGIRAVDLGLEKVSRDGDAVVRGGVAVRRGDAQRVLVVAERELLHRDGITRRGELIFHDLITGPHRSKRSPAWT